MITGVLRKVFGSANDRIVKKCARTVLEINRLEPSFESLTDEQLREKTVEFKQRYASGQSLDQLLPEAFACVREASKRVLGMRPFDVQLIGGMVLHQGMISEMRTGEGKTLVATLPVYLNALSGKGVHVVTVNDYLAKRDATWMGQLYNFLGLSYGCIVHGLTDQQRREAYLSDITYGTNHEFGFDYLRDNMKFRLSERVMRPFNYAIVDEADSILIDEARTPLIISGAAEDSSELYIAINALIPHLQAEDYEKDEKQRSVTLTDNGVEKIEKLLFEKGLIKGQGLYDVQNINIVHHVNSALKAHMLFTRDVDYMVKNGKVMIIDEFTGRIMEGRRYSDGLHQALEAKEGVDVEMENQTLASITYQNFFRLYPKFSGMSGTAMTEASEFEEIYKLRPVEIPTNVPVARKDYDDEVFLTAQEKYQAIIKQIHECFDRGQPVLVGTTSIEKSELLSSLLKNEKIPHNVLNARYHEQEAYIVAEAGRSKAVTIATNMAGRGTDIKLGGNVDMRIERELSHIQDENERQAKIAQINQEAEEDQKKVKEAGGLFVIGTERHESRRIDNQLRGRSGRQGDPGASRFYLSLEDDLMRIFGSPNLVSRLRKIGVEEGEAISHRMINKSIERAQRMVEARNFDIRKHLLRYDDVMNDQRKIVYEQRLELMTEDDISDVIEDLRQDVINHLVESHIPEDALPEQWDIKGLHAQAIRLFDLNLPLESWINEKDVTVSTVKQSIQNEVKEHMLAKEEKFGEQLIRMAEKTLLMRLLDQYWKEHLLALDHLRQGINLRAYAQSNPLNEYKREAFNLFQLMMWKIKEEVTASLSHFTIQLPEGLSMEDAMMPEVDFSHMEESSEDDRTQALSQEGTLIENQDRINRNAPCPCNSGKKYKHCHGTL